MPVKLVCPNCSKELNAPDELVGKLVACPRCSTQFPVTQAVGASSAVAPNVPTHAPMSRESRSGDGTAPPMLQIRSFPTSDMMPPSESSAAPATAHRPVTQPLPPNVPQPASDGANVARPIAQPPPTVPPSPPRSNTRAVPPAPPATRPPAPARRTTTAAPSQRPAQTAKFVADGAVKSRIHLGADGQLPDLVVHETKQKEERQEKREGTNPLLLVLVLCFSVGISIVMLFVPTDLSQQESTSKEQARRDVVEFYIGKQPPFELYQQRLREALQAEDAGDKRAARRKYREVLDMLHAEANGGRDWLTGPTYENINHRPNDRDLEELLTTLLSDN